MTVPRAHMVPWAAVPGTPSCSREEFIADAVLHAAGIVGALIAVPVLVTLIAVWYGSVPEVTAAVIYGIGLIAMFALSACYHLSWQPRFRKWFRRLDHAAIYVKIAATYTPFAILAAGAEAALMLAAIWTAAALGVAVKLVSARRWEIAGLALYFAMGWAILVIGGPVIAGVSATTYGLMMAGGIVYSLGVVFLYLPRLRFHNAIWHGHVLAASFIFYAALIVEAAHHAPSG